VTTATADFAEALREYDVALTRMQGSHDRLLDRVAELQAESQRKNDLLAHRERMAVLGELAAGVAHEIRNPLGGIRLYLDLLARERGLEQHPTVGKIRGVVSRLDRVVHDVLTHSREVQVQRADTPLTYVVMEAVTLASQELPEGEIKLYVDCADGHANVDADLVARALLNLILNAAQAIRGRDDGREGGSVHICARIDKEEAVFEVRDDGPGIPAEMLHRLFTPFFTSKGGGTGLGLALCRRIAENHGGTIEAANHPDGGAKFTLKLPASG
jgi:signal transduction histidine kinase